MSSRLVNDGLQSLYGGLGDLNRDKAAGVHYGLPYMTPPMLLNAYRSSWLARKIVDIPAGDAIRKWRDWQADGDDITAIENTEKRLNLRLKVGAALQRARLFGGAAIYIGTDQDPTKPLDVERVGKDGLRFLSVISKHALTPTELDLDPTSETFEKPKMYRITNNRVREIHPSHLAIFHGHADPDPLYSMIEAGWGDSVLLSTFRAITNLDASMANVASLIFEANVDVFGVPELLEKISDPKYEAQILARFGIAAVNKGINRSIIRDANETYDRHPVSFSGLAELFDKFFQFVSGAADIPATRFLGMSPSGLSSTGEADLRNYYDTVSTGQNVQLTPAIHSLDECLIRSALGDRPSEIFYLWSPLWQVSDKERTDMGKTMAETANLMLGTGLIKPEALSRAVVNTFTENGIYPGLEKLVNEVGPIDFEAQEQEKAERAAAQIEAMATLPGIDAADMAPTSLYISRKVVNADTITAWAARQGIEIADPSDLHVTVCYSRAPLDWFEVGEPWSSRIVVPEGGPRLVERFDGGAVVLRFAANELNWRHRQVMEAGGSHDYPEYAPHITLKHELPGVETVDLSTVQPYTGEIILGPEIFETVKK